MYIPIFPGNLFQGDVVMEWTTSEVALAVFAPFP